MDGMIGCCVTVNCADADADVVDFVLDIGGTKISGKWKRANIHGEQRHEMSSARTKRVCWCNEW